MAVAAAQFPPLLSRPIRNTICLFDVDDTLTPARQAVSPEMLGLLQKLRGKVVIGFVGGSNLSKQQEQLGINGLNVADLFDYCFAENGLTAFRLGEPLPSNSFIKWLGEEKYKKLANFILHYIADLDIPIKRGTFIEFRNGMINVSPIGRNATIQERNDYEKYDLEHHVRRDFITALKSAFPDYGLTFSVGGKISFDVFPTGWDKTYCLQHVQAEKVPGWEESYFKEIHFFGDKTYKGGNDYEIYEDPRTVGHSVKNPEETMELIRSLFGL